MNEKSHTMITKNKFCGPVTALCCASFGSSEYLFWGSGGTLHVYNKSSCKTLHHLPLFEHNIIHDIVAYPESATVLIFGSISFTLLSFDGSSLVNITKERYLDDWVLNCALANVSETTYTVIIGYAHNFFDVVEISKEGCLTLIERCQCVEKVALFTLSFSCKNSVDDIFVASGNVFGKLTIWKRQDAGSSRILCNIHRHEGVVFRITWGEKRDKLMTVSDDRTLRLWHVDYHPEDDNYSISQVFVGWGHVSRLWDAIFTKPDESEIATCSEDGTIKVWDLEGKCHTTLVGHTGSVWRIAVDRNYENLISAGNDAAIKTWNLAYHRITSPQEVQDTATDMLIPTWHKEATVANEIVAAEEGIVVHSKQDNRRNNGVTWLKVSPCGKYLVLVLINGKVWFITLHNHTETGKLQSEDWKPLVDVEETIITADAHFYPLNSSSSLPIFFILATVKGHSHYIHAEVQFNDQINNHVDSIAILSKHVWKPHVYKTVNVWIAKNPETTHAVDPSYPLLVMTSTLHGICNIWKYNPLQHDMTLDFVIQTEKQEIATSYAFKCTALPNTAKLLSYLIVGDSRGSVNLYNITAIRSKEVQHKNDHGETIVIHKPDQCHLYLHSTDPVSAIATTKTGFLTAGHDNMLHFYNDCLIQREGAAKAEEESEYELRWILESSMTTMPIHTPDQLFVFENEESNNQDESQQIDTASIYICGYHGSAYIVHDLRRGYQLMRIEGGGWKRAHCGGVVLPMFSNTLSKGRNKVDLSNLLPDVLFVCPAPLGKKETVLQTFGTRHSAIKQNEVAQTPWPLQLGCNSFGKVSYAGIIVQYPAAEETASLQSLAIVGGEDCTLKVFSLHAETTALLQEITLSKNSSLKCLASVAANPKTGLIVGGGGKLLYYIWSYQLDGCGSHEAKGMTPVRKLYVGSAWPNASQDHRIMSINIQSVGSYTRSYPAADGEEHNSNKEEQIEQFVLLLTDSRGCLTVIDIHVCLVGDAENASCLQRVCYIKQYANVNIATVRYQLEVSPCPLLSSSIIALTSSDNNDATKYLLATLGDTRGQAIVVLIPLVCTDATNKNKSNKRFMIGQPKIICDYVAHAMGTNAIITVPITSTTTNNQNDDTVYSWDLVICSAGDDQSVTAQQMQVSIAWEEKKLACRLSPTANYPGAASTAFKGISFLRQEINNDNFYFSTIACDQRLSIWTVKDIQSMLLSCDDNNSSTLQWKEIPFFFSYNNSDDDAVSQQSITANISEHEHFFFPFIEPLANHVAPKIEWTAGSIVHVTEMSSLSVATHPMKPSRSASPTVHTGIVVGEGFEIVDIVC